MNGFYVYIVNCFDMKWMETGAKGIEMEYNRVKRELQGVK